MKGSQRMRKRILVLLLLGSTVTVHGDALPIHLVWDEVAFRGGAINVAESVELHRNRAIVGEILGRPVGFNTDAVVKGFNAATGQLVWSDEIANGERVFVGAAGSQAIAVASIPPIEDGIHDGLNIVVRSYDLGPGTIRYTAYAKLNAPQQILIRNGKLVIVGYDQETFRSQVRGLIVVLDIDTGQVLWTAPVENPIHMVLWDVDQAGRFIIAVGVMTDFASPTFPPPQTAVIRSYRLRDGHLRWERLEPGVVTYSIAVLNDTATIAGGEGFGTFLAAYNIADGSMKWKAASQLGFGPFLGVFSSNTKIVAFGSGQVVSFDTAGNLQWSNSNLFRSVARAFVVGDFVLTAGTEVVPPLSPEAPNQLVVRLYDAAGQVAQEDRREIGRTVFYGDAALQNGRLAVVGRTSGALVRVYDMRPFE